MTAVNHQKRAVEALLFASDKPVKEADIMSCFDEDFDLEAVLAELQEDYAERGINLVNRDGHWVFRTSPDLKSVLSRTKPVEKQISRAALETLAIIAYHQPLTRAEIENIRGIATSKGTIDTLIESGWIKPGRRRDTPGRPLTWVTTNDFLDHFNLGSIMDLPGLDEMKASGLLDSRPAIEAVPDMNDLFEEYGETESKETHLT